MLTCIRYLLAFLFLYNYVNCQTITSTTTGGSWESAATWIGGVIPAEGNDVIINGTVSVTSSGSVCNNLTVNTGQVLQNGGGLGWVTLHIKGNLINNGSIRNNPGGNSFNIECWRNLQNNGEISLWYLYLPAQNVQYISQAAGRYFDADVRSSDVSGWGYSTGSLNAASDLTFSKSVQLTGYIANVGEQRTMLNMAGYNLILRGEGELYNSTVQNAASIATRDNARIRSSNFVGNTILKETGRIDDSNVYFENDLTVSDTLQNGGSLGWVNLHIKGNLTNNGYIRNNLQANQLNVEAWGNVYNNGEINIWYVYFPGQKTQYISQSGGKYFNADVRASDASGYGYNTGSIIAASDLTFKKSVVLTGYIVGVGDQVNTIDMAGYNLLLSGEAQLYNAIIKNISSVTTLDNASVASTTFEGDVSIKGTGRMSDSRVYFNGNVTVIDTLQNGGNLGWLTPVITGNITNYGAVKNSYQGNSLCLDIRGNIYNYGYWNIWQTLLKTEGTDRYISGTFNTSFYMYKSGTPASGDVYVDGSLVNQNEIIFKDGIQLIIKPGSVFANSGAIRENGTVINNGVFTSTHNLEWYDKLNSGLNASMELTDRKTLENVTITYNYNAIHSLMSSSVKQWWRFAGKGEPGGYKLTLKYDTDMLNGMNPEQLEVYISPDSGLSWTKVSTPLNITRNTEEHTITVGTNDYPLTAAMGDIILSTGESIPVPSISSAIGGRRQIRVGPPNRYTVSYWNNGDAPTDMFCYQLQTNNGVHIKSVITKDINTNEPVEIPVDSLSDSNNEVLLFVQPLASKEVRSFDIILTADPDVTGKQREFITFTAVALWIGGAMLEEYISNTMVEGCYEMWRPVSNDQSLTDASINCVKNSMRKALTVENGAKGIAKKAAGEIIEKTGRVAVWPVMLASDILDCLGNTVKGMKDYVNGNFDKQDKELTKVTSWDPNAKEGPAGYGSQGYLATSAPMLYTIFFENKKEATAPAYQITIYDTLDQNVYDVNTVKFLEMSHSMGKATQQGNILKWEFTGIELVPNINPPEGEGWVKFIVHPKNSLVTGTTLQNKAVIKFDSNPWLATNTYTNTLDFESPVTTPVSVKRLSANNEILFSWANNDGEGSGVKTTTVYISVNDGPYTVAAVSDSSSAVINISTREGYKYKFYGLAKDNVGNVETEPSGTMEILTGINEDKIPLPGEFVLKQNYPNPFNPATTIAYELPEKGNVKLLIYNLLGEEVAVLINEEKDAGRYYINWNASEFSSGVYFCKIVYNNKKSLITKMVLIK